MTESDPPKPHYKLTFETHDRTIKETHTFDTREEAELFASQLTGTEIPRDPINRIVWFRPTDQSPRVCITTISPTKRERERNRHQDQEYARHSTRP